MPARPFSSQQTNLCLNAESRLYMPGILQSLQRLLLLLFRQMEKTSIKSSRNSSLEHLILVADPVHGPLASVAAHSRNTAHPGFVVLESELAA